MGKVAIANDETPKRLTRDEISAFCNLIGMAPRMLVQAREDVTERYDLGPRGAWVLGLAQRGVDSPSRLTEILRIQRSLVTLELARLTDAGLIVTERNRSDGRRLVIKLTPKGRRVCGELEDAIEHYVLERLDGVDRADLLAMIEALRVFVGPTEGFHKAPASEC